MYIFFLEKAVLNVFKGLFYAKNANFGAETEKNGERVFPKTSFFYLLPREFCKDHYTLSEFLAVRDPSRAVAGVSGTSFFEVRFSGGLCTLPCTIYSNNGLSWSFGPCPG